jgi:hypothetical protein
MKSLTGLLLFSLVMMVTAGLSQNVGIGTTTPPYKLTVQTGSPAYGMVHTNGTIAVGSFIGNYGINGGWYGTVSNHPLMFFTFNGPAQMTLLQNGNTGIGTLTPDFKLTVESNIIQANNNTHVLKLKGRNPVLSFSDENNNSFGYIKMWSNAPSVPYSNGFVIGANPGYPIFLSTNNYGVSVTVADNGNVGIGTAAPTDKLTVLTADASYGLVHTNGTIAIGTFVGGSASAGWLGTKSNHPLNFFTNNASGGVQMSLLPNGQVSIDGGPGAYQSPVLTLNGSNTFSGGLTLKGSAEWRMSVNSSGILNFWQNGIEKAYVDGSGDWTTASDETLKENLSPYKAVLENVQNLHITTYRYKSNAPDSRSFGLIAQNVARYFPEIVSEMQDKDGRKILGVAYGKTGVLALKAIQEQQVIIDDKQKQIDDKQKQIDELKARLEKLENARGGK